MKTPNGEVGHSPTSVTVGTSVKRFMDINPMRQNAMVTNNSSIVCYIGLSMGVNSNNGLQLNEGDVFIIDKDNPYSGELFAITASGTANLRIMQVSRAVNG